MPVKVLMPQMGESVNEGTIAKWLKTRGDSIRENEPLLEINTDKVDSEIVSPASGVVLDILAEAGATVQSGTLLAWIGAPGEAPSDDAPTPPAARPAGSEPAPKSIPTLQAAGRSRELGFISPVVARLAGEHGIDLARVRGSGANGRITKLDVEAYLQGRQGETTQPAAPARIEPRPSAPQPSPNGGDSLLPLSPVRRAIAEHMVMSKHTSPHVTTVMEVDFSRVAAHREANKAAFARDGVNLTYTAYLVAAIAAALKAFPLVNSSWSEQGILLHRQVNIGMATSLGEDGLIVPVIKNAGEYNLLGLARAVNDLAARARARKLQPDEVKGGTFTLTNHGVTGSLFATPIINQPQCAILGAGAIQKRVVVVSDKLHGDSIAIRPMAYLTLTFDHRILDGALGDNFLSRVVESLQNWG